MISSVDQPSAQTEPAPPQDCSLSPAWSLLRGFEPVSLCDWPEKISCVLFFGGCNFRCPTCHNFQIAWTPENVPEVSRNSVLENIASRKKWLEGIVVTGGEPTILPEFECLIEELASYELPLKIDTNGTKPELVSRLLEAHRELTFAVDVKGPWEKYPSLSGYKVTPEAAKRSLSEIFALAESRPARFYFRTTQVPELLDSDLNEVRSYLPSGFPLHVQQYRPVSTSSST